MKYIDLDKKICCNDVIQCIFNLNDQEIKLYRELKKTGEIRADTLSKIVKKERSTVYRSLQKLTCAKLVIKKTNIIKSGGYYHTYICNNKIDIKNNIENCVDNWYRKMKNTLLQIEKEI
jgi:predicted transcriptional regulator